MNPTSARSVLPETPAHSAGATGSAALAALECMVGKARVALPVSAIRQIIEYEVAHPIPLLARFIGGLSVYEGRVLVSIALTARDDAKRNGTVVQSGWRKARAVLLASVQEDDVCWGFEVTEVRNFVHVTRHEHPRAPGQRPFPPWMSVRETSDGRALGWIEVEAMLTELREGR